MPITRCGVASKNQRPAVTQEQPMSYIAPPQVLAALRLLAGSSLK